MKSGLAQADPRVSSQSSPPPGGHTLAKTTHRKSLSNRHNRAAHYRAATALELASNVSRPLRQCETPFADVLFLQLAQMPGHEITTAEIADDVARIAATHDR